MDIFVLYLSQILGYFPINPKLHDNKSNKQILIKRHLVSLPTAFYAVLFILIVTIFLANIDNFQTNEIWVVHALKFQSRTFIASITLISIADLFVSVYLQMSIYLKRKELGQFYTKFWNLCHNPVFQKLNQENRYCSRSRKELLICVLFVMGTMVEILQMYVIDMGGKY